MPDFFSLPGEIRNQIYRYVGQDEDGVILLPGGGPTLSRTFLYPRIPPLMQVSRQVRQECGQFLSRPRILECVDYPAFVQCIDGLGRPWILNLNHLDLRVSTKVRTLNNPSDTKLCDLYVTFERYNRSTEQANKSVYLVFDFAEAPGAIVDRTRLCNLVIVPSELRRIVKGLAKRLALIHDLSIHDLMGLIEYLCDGDTLVSPFVSPGSSVDFLADSPCDKANSFMVRNNRAECTLSSAYRRVDGGGPVFYWKDWEVKKG